MDIRIELDYAYGQMKPAPETSKHCNFAITGEKLKGYYRFRKGFYDPADIPTIFQEKIDRPLGHETPVWLDDIIVFTRGTKEEHTKKLELKKLENEGLQSEQEKIKILSKGNSLAWTHYRSRWNKAEQSKDGSNKQTKPPTNTKTLKSFFGAIQYFSKFIPNLSEKTDNMRQLLKKGANWEWTEERNTDFNNFKRKLNSQLCLTHYN